MLRQRGAFRLILWWLTTISACCSATSCRSAPSGAHSRGEPSEPHCTVPAGEVRLLARSVGGSPALIVINGGPGASHHAIGRLESLASPTLRVVLYDQRGMGGSSAPASDNGYALDDYVADLEALRTGLGLTKVHLLGHSFGGLIAMAYAAAHPDRLESLILVSSRAPDWEHQQLAMDAFRERFAKLIADKKIPSRPPDTVGDDCREQSSASLPVLFADPDFRGPIEETKTTACSIHVREMTEKLLRGYDLRPKLKSFAAPTLVLIGDADPFGDAMGRATAAAFESTRPQYEVLARCGHFPWIECPDAFRQKLEPFLTRVTHR
jgi:pimeloyl-ACP methyl ester carboxylesterase